MEISIRELKTNPSYYIRCAEQGELVWITAHKRMVARLIAVTKQEPQLHKLELPNINWSGKKPALPHQRLQIEGKSLADTVLEMR
ncbi:MAG: hypothetical protein WBP46_12990 [Thiolinea sp.]